MKNPLQSLLIFLSLCLCALIAVQWHRETRLRLEVQKLTDTIHDKMENIQNLQAALKRTEEDVMHLTRKRDELTDLVKSNRLDIDRLTKEVEKTQQESDKNLRQSEAYKGAYDQANENVKTANVR